MWIQFGPPALRWLTFACFVICVIGMMAMPKDERRRLLRGAHLRRSRRASPQISDLPVTLADPWNADVGGASQHAPIDAPRSLRTVGTFVTAGRLLLAASAFVLLLLLAWMAIAFVLSVPGWR